MMYMVERRKRGWHKIGWVPPHKTPPEKIKQIEELVEQGYMNVQIEEITGISHATVSKYISSYIERKLHDR